jgi:hypothetical protein
VDQASGHFFVIEGDLRRLFCDALLLPTDARMSVTELWAELVGRNPGQRGPLTDFEAPSGWGSTVHTCLYSAATNAPAVWLTEIGLAFPSEEELLANVGAFLDEASKHSSSPLPCLALPVVGTRRGGMKHDKGAVYKSLVPFLIEYAAAHPVDIVLVTYGRRQYSAAQRARKKAVGSSNVPFWDLGPRADELREVSSVLADACSSDQLVPFLGAGISAAAGAPSWQALLDEMFIESGGTESDFSAFHELDLRDQASLLRRFYNNDTKYHQAISNRVGLERHSLSHGLLASLGTTENVTTNYDDLFERACSGPDSELAVLPYETVERDRGHRWLLKLHGSLSRPDDIVLTRDDYLGLPARAGALFGLVQAILLTRHMFFVGYSLSDESFHKVLHEVRMARRGLDPANSGNETPRRLGTALVLQPEPLFAQLFEDDLDIVAIADADEDVATAARRFAIFLDHLAYQAADVSSFLMDPTYASMLNPEERATAEQLSKVRDNLTSGPIGQAVQSLLDRLGSTTDPE